MRNLKSMGFGLVKSLELCRAIDPSADIRLEKTFDFYDPKTR